MEGNSINGNYPIYSKRQQRSRKTILMLGPLPPTVGGITTFIKGVAQSDVREKYRLVVFGTERPTAGILREADDYTIMFHIGSARLASSVATTISHILKFPVVLTIHRPHIVHVNTASYWSFWENAAYILMARLFSRKAIIHIHGGLFFQFYADSNVIIKFLIRRVLETANKIIVLSPRWKYLLADIISSQRLLEERVVVLGNFVDSSKFANSKREMGSSKGTIDVLFVGGTGAKAKGVYDVLKIIPRVVSECKNVFFHLVACGNVKKPDSIAGNETFASHTKFLDYVSDDGKMKVFDEADIFVLPSYFEGFPITMLEAMAAGLPVVATPVGSIPEVIEEGKNGFLIKAGDYQALAEKILILAKDEKLRLKMATNNIEKVRKRYDKSLVMRKLGKLYDQVLYSS